MQPSVPNSGTITIHGPYEDAIIAQSHLLEKIIDGQDPATRKELWSRFLEETKPWHDLGVALSEAIAGALKNLFKPGG